MDQLKVPDVAASSVDLSSFRLSRSSSDFYLWHSRLGHVSASRLQFLASTGVLGHIKSCDISYCSGFKLAKFSALPFNKKDFLCLLFHLILFILMCGDPLLFLQKGVNVLCFVY